MGKIMVIGSQKGGVGKTTTTLNLAYSLKEMGKKVLTVDFDSQANLTTCYGIEDTGALEYTIGHLMMAQITFKVERAWIIFHHLFICLWWMQSLEQRWERRGCWQRFWNRLEVDMITY